MNGKRRKVVIGILLGLFCLVLFCFCLVLSFLNHILEIEQEDIESGFHPDFNIAQKNVQQNPHNIDYKLPYAMALYDKKLYVKALAELEPLLKRGKPQPNDTTTQQCVYLYAAKILIGMGKSEQAKVYLRELVKIDPPHYEAGSTIYSMGNAAQELLNSIP